MLEWYNRGTIVGNSCKDSLRVELSAQLNNSRGVNSNNNDNSPNSSSSTSSSLLSPPSSLEMVYGLVQVSSLDTIMSEIIIIVI